MTADALQYEGLHYSKANDAILEDLKSAGALLASERITHSYPHCWRCKNPIIFRATEQWFASVDAIKDAAADACEGILWIPEWGKERMIAMIRERSDWCISRQRHWGLPIPVFYCDDCGKPVCTPESVEAVANLFAAHGSNIWFDQEAGDILPKGFVCPHCGGARFTKGADTLDGWFDSGSTHAAVLEKFAGLVSPADVYLEGGDQYRGWFQSSMLTSIATRGRAPYRIVITNGWALDGEGRTMHKSLGNVISPEEIVREYGADVLRLWVSSTDYRANLRLSKDVLKQMSDMYLKIRNTARYILGNLDGFDPDGAVAFEDLEPLDQWALSRVNELVRRSREAYDAFEYHTVCHGLHNFCAVELSNFYLDVIKDRLYCDKRDSKSGRGARSAIYGILDKLVRLLAPILAFTAEEIWAAMPHHSGVDRASVLFNDMPAFDEKRALPPDAREMWERLLALRGVVNRALEAARADKIIGKPLDAEVTLFVTPTAPGGYDAALALDLAPLFVVSKVTVVREAVPGAPHGLSATVRASGEIKCARCWTHNAEINSDGLCPRCAEAVR
jgi:isoleucyl-tRNA synthetase